MNDDERSERDAARERQSFVRHELRAPLAVIYPLLELLRSEGAGPLTDKQRDYLEVLERNVRRLAGMQASATESGWLDCTATPDAPAAVPLGEVVEEALAARRLDESEGPSVDVVRAPGPRAVARADPDHVRSIVRDLLDNAVHFTPPDRNVMVRVGGGEAASTVRLAVRDEGCGMPPEEVARAFEFGFRGAAAREAGVTGLGAGLWVCRQLVERNGGRIVLDSVPGAGTTVTVTLPSAPKGD